MQPGESPFTGSEAKRERQDQYLQWLLTPKGMRKPKTKTALAEQLGVTLQTLHNYDRERSFQRKVANERARVGRVERAEDVLNALYQRALNDLEPGPANTAAKIWLEHTFTDLAEVTEDVDVQSMSDEQVMEMAMRVLGKLSERSG